MPSSTYGARPFYWTPLNRAHRLNQGLVGYWPLGEGGGTTAQDKSGNGNNGTLTNMAMTPTSGWGRGKFGGALVFDGSNDFVNMGNVLGVEKTDAFSYSAWIKLSSATPSTPQEIIAKVNGSYVGLSFIVRGDIVNDPVEFELRGSSTFLSMRSSQVWTTNWTHLVWTYDGSVTASGMRLYRDGVLQSATTEEATLTSQSIANTGSFLIGAFQTVPNNLFAGRMSEVRAYNRMLSAHEVRQLHRDPFGMYQQNEPVWISGAPPVDTSLSAAITIGVTTNTPTLTVAKALAAAATVSLTTTATLVSPKPLAASGSVSVTTGTPVLSVPKALSATTSISMTTSAALGVAKPLNAAVTVSVTTTGDIASGAKPLDANVALALSCAGSITIAKPLAAVLDPIVFTIGGTLAITWNSGRIIAAPTATLRAALVALGMAAVAAEPIGSTRSDGVPFGALGVAAEPSSGQRSAAVAEGALIVASASANHLAQSSVVGEPQS